MEKKIAWVTDSSILLPKQAEDIEDVFVIPLTIIFGETEYADGVTIHSDELYEKIETERELPKTSRPPIDQLVTIYNELSLQYDVIYSIHASNHLSGTYESAVLAARQCAVKVYPIDSLSTSFGVSYLIEKGKEWIGAGINFDEVFEKIETLKKKARAYMIPGSLKQLLKGGRITGYQYLLGNALNINPILTFIDGKAEPYKRVRTRKKAENKILENMIESLKAKRTNQFFLSHSCEQSRFEEWENRLKQFSQEVRIRINPLSSVLGVHGGENSILVMWYDDQE